MVPQSVTPYNSPLLNPSYLKPDELTARSHGKSSQSGQTLLDASRYSVDQLAVNFSNKDGDTVSLTMGHVEFEQARLVTGGERSPEEWKQVVDNIKDEFLRFQGRIIQKFISSLDGNKPQETEETDAPTDEIPGLPEYWNAENTSQRIVDFATSFYGVAESVGKDYYDMMRGAIEEGFNQAMGILGELPDAVGNLANSTFDLAMQKLDEWAIGQGIDIGENAAA